MSILYLHICLCCRRQFQEVLLRRAAISQSVHIFFKAGHGFFPAVAITHQNANWFRCITLTHTAVLSRMASRKKENVSQVCVEGMGRFWMGFARK